MNELKIVCLMNELLGHRKSRAVPKGPCCHLELDRRVRALESSVADGLRNQGFGSRASQRVLNLPYELEVCLGSPGVLMRSTINPSELVGRVRSYRCLSDASESKGMARALVVQW